eukprot:jgi/Mesvir1/21354/Mv20843-RA.1
MPSPSRSSKTPQASRPHRPCAVKDIAAKPALAGPAGDAPPTQTCRADMLKQHTTSTTSAVAAQLSQQQKLDLREEAELVKCSLNAILKNFDVEEGDVPNAGHIRGAVMDDDITSRLDAFSSNINDDVGGWGTGADDGDTHVYAARPAGSRPSPFRQPGEDTSRRDSTGSGVNSPARDRNAQDAARSGQKAPPPKGAARPPSELRNTNNSPALTSARGQQPSPAPPPQKAAAAAPVRPRPGPSGIPAPPDSKPRADDSSGDSSRSPSRGTSARRRAGSAHRSGQEGPPTSGAYDSSSSSSTVAAPGSRDVQRRPAAEPLDPMSALEQASQGARGARRGGGGVSAGPGAWGDDEDDHVYAAGGAATRARNSEMGGIGGGLGGLSKGPPPPASDSRRKPGGDGGGTEPGGAMRGEGGGAQRSAPPAEPAQTSEQILAGLSPRRSGDDGMDWDEAELGADRGLSEPGAAPSKPKRKLSGPRYRSTKQKPVGGPQETAQSPEPPPQPLPPQQHSHRQHQAPPPPPQQQAQQLSYRQHQQQPPPAQPHYQQQHQAQQQQAPAPQEVHARQRHPDVMKVSHDDYGRDNSYMDSGGGFEPTVGGWGAEPTVGGWGEGDGLPQLQGMHLTTKGARVGHSRADMQADMLPHVRGAERQPPPGARQGKRNPVDAASSQAPGGGYREGPRREDSMSGGKNGAKAQEASKRLQDYIEKKRQAQEAHLIKKFGWVPQDKIRIGHVAKANSNKLEPMGEPPPAPLDPTGGLVPKAQRPLSGPPNPLLPPLQPRAGGVAKALPGDLHGLAKGPALPGKKNAADGPLALKTVQELDQELQVLKHVHARENALERLTKCVGMLNAKGWESNMLKLELQSASQALITASLDVVDAIETWRKDAGRSAPFLWNGANYMSKMRADLAFMAASPHILHWLGPLGCQSPLLFSPDALPSPTDTPNDNAPMSVSLCAPKLMVSGADILRARLTAKLLQREPLPEGYVPAASIAQPLAPVHGRGHGHGAGLGAEVAGGHAAPGGDVQQGKAGGLPGRRPSAGASPGGASAQLTPFQQEQLRRRQAAAAAQGQDAYGTSSDRSSVSLGAQDRNGQSTDATESLHLGGGRAGGAKPGQRLSHDDGDMEAEMLVSQLAARYLPRDAAAVGVTAGATASASSSTGHEDDGEGDEEDGGAGDGGGRPEGGYGMGGAGKGGQPKGGYSEQERPYPGGEGYGGGDQENPDSDRNDDASGYEPGGGGDDDGGIMSGEEAEERHSLGGGGMEEEGEDEHEGMRDEGQGSGSGQSAGGYGHRRIGEREPASPADVSEVEAGPADVSEAEVPAIVDLDDDGDGAKEMVTAGTSTGDFAGEVAVHGEGAGGDDGRSSVMDVAGQVDRHEANASRLEEERGADASMVVGQEETDASTREEQAGASMSREAGPAGPKASLTGDRVEGADASSTAELTSGGQLGGGRMESDAAAPSVDTNGGEGTGGGGGGHGGDGGHQGDEGSEYDQLDEGKWGDEGVGGDKGDGDASGATEVVRTPEGDDQPVDRPEAEVAAVAPSPPPELDGGIHGAEAVDGEGEREGFKEEAAAVMAESPPPQPQEGLLMAEREDGEDEAGRVGEADEAAEGGLADEAVVDAGAGKGDAGASSLDAGEPSAEGAAGGDGALHVEGEEETTSAGAEMQAEGGGDNGHGDDGDEGGRDASAGDVRATGDAGPGEDAAGPSDDEASKGAADDHPGRDQQGQDGEGGDGEGNGGAAATAAAAVIATAATGGVVLVEEEAEDALLPTSPKSVDSLEEGGRDRDVMLTEGEAGGEGEEEWQGAGDGGIDAAAESREGGQGIMLPTMLMNTEDEQGPNGNVASPEEGTPSNDGDGSRPEDGAGGEAEGEAEGEAVGGAGDDVPSSPAAADEPPAEAGEDGGAPDEAGDASSPDEDGAGEGPEEGLGAAGGLADEGGDDAADACATADEDAASPGDDVAGEAGDIDLGGDGEGNQDAPKGDHDVADADDAAAGAPAEAREEDVGNAAEGEAVETTSADPGEQQGELEGELGADGGMEESSSANEPSDDPMNAEEPSDEPANADGPSAEPGAAEEQDPPADKEVPPEGGGDDQPADEPKPDEAELEENGGGEVEAPADAEAAPDDPAE